MTGAAPVSIARDASQTDRALLGIRDMVLRGDFRAGDRLAEVELAERLGVSRTPVRTALQRLEEEGLLELARPTGYIVRSFTRADIDDAIEVRGTLEALAARMAAERGVSRLVLGEMRECLADIDRVLAEQCVDVEHLNRYAASNARFHELILEAAGSPMVRRSLQRVAALPFASPNAFVLMQGMIPDAFNLLRIAQMQHHDIADAIESRAGARVDALVKEHARIARKNLEIALRHTDAINQVPGGPLIQRRTG